MIKLSNVNYTIDDFTLKDISIEINEGECFSIVGSSGSGKSVLIDLILGFRKVKSGKIAHKNEDITYKPIHNRPFRVVFQDFSLFPHLTVSKNIEYGLKSFKLTKNEKLTLIQSWAQKCDVFHLLNRGVSDLSGGEKQRVALARSLVTQPDILILDEPLSSLDVNLKEEFITLFRNLNNSGLTIIYVTHDFEEAAKLSHRIALIDQGQMIQIGKLLDFYNSPRHPFVAKFAGHKNVFKANLKYNPITQLTEANVADSNVTVFVSGRQIGDAYIFIPEESIILSNEKQVSSAQNSFAASVEELICFGSKTHLKINVGVVIQVVVSNESIRMLKIVSNSKIFIQFKATSVGIIPEIL